MQIPDFIAPSRFPEGLAHVQQGRMAEAEACFLDVIAKEPTNTEALKFLAITALSREDLNDALSYAMAAVHLKPENGEYLHLLGRIQRDGGDVEAAAVSLQGALAKNPSMSLEISLDLMDAYAMSGAWDDALALVEAQLVEHPANSRALLAAAKLHRSLGDVSTSWLYAERALSLAPHDPDLHFMTRVIRAEAVPAWHFNMMNDATRNAAFKRAIERQIKPHHVVLEIGTGAGLLAMMAARTGARIFTCESNPALATTARGLIAHNGLTERITVIDKPSWELEVGVDLSQQADVLIAEIFSAQLLSEDVIPTLEDAKRRLLKPGGVVIPAAATMIGALVQSDDLAALTRVSHVEGLDFSPFNAFTPVLMSLDTPNYALDWLSQPIALLHFDFQNQDEFPALAGQVAVEVRRDGFCQGVVQWLQIMLDDKTPYENAPLGASATRTKHWTPLFYPFPTPRELKAGQTVMLRIGHDRKGARVELAEIV